MLSNTNNPSTGITSLPAGNSSYNNATASNRPLFIAKFNSQAAAIRRNPDYTATIASICKAFPALKLADPSLIYLSANLDGFEDLSLYITDDVWDEVLPGLTVVEVSTEDGAHAVAKESETVDALVRAVVEPPTEAIVEPEPIIIHVRYKHANNQDLLLPILPTATVQQLKSFIVEHDNHLYPHMVLSCERHPTLDDCMTLDKYGIENETTVFLSTEFEVYLAGPEERVAVSIVTSATVSVLAELLRDLARQNVGFSSSQDRSFEQILSCAGEVLRHSRKLGSYRQVVPGCVICVNEPKFHPVPTSSRSVTLSVRKHSVENISPELEVIPQFEVEPESTVLDLKILLGNRRKTSAVQVLKIIRAGGDFPTRELRDNELIEAYSMGGAPNLWFMEYGLTPGSGPPNMDI